MPITKISKNKWEVDGVEYASEKEAEKAYQAILALKLGVPPKDKKKTTKED